MVQSSMNQWINELLARGWSEAEILRNYPGLVREGIQACLAYPSERLHSERVHPLSAP